MPPVATNLGFDLKLGIENFVTHIPHANGIDLILKWITANSHLVLNRAQANPQDSFKLELELASTFRVN